MKLLVATLVAGLAATLFAGGDANAGEKDLKPAQAFKEWGDYFVGVWTTTNAQGKKEELRCEWILDKSFIRLTWMIGDQSREEIHGIDPATGQWTIAGFDSKGRVYNCVAKSEKAGEWNYRVAGQGKDGPMSWKSKDIKLGADEPPGATPFRLRFVSSIRPRIPAAFQSSRHWPSFCCQTL